VIAHPAPALQVSKDIPRDEKSGCEGLGMMRPSGCFVVEGAGFEASVEDADEAVCELADPDRWALGPGAARGRRARRPVEHPRRRHRRRCPPQRYCTEIGRDPASIIHSIHLPVSYDQPGITRATIGEAIDAGFRHIVLGLPAPYPANVARRVTDELITTSTRALQ
jgi:hypothetical protein